MKDLITKVAEIQLGLNAPKDQEVKNKMYRYRTKEGILEAVKPLLNGLALTVQDEVIFIEGRFYVKTTAIITDGENDISATALAREPETQQSMISSQITGSASSYAGKNALGNLLAIDDNKDPDSIEAIITIEQACYLEKLLDGSTFKGSDEYDVLLGRIPDLLVVNYEKSKAKLIAHQLNPITEGGNASAKDIQKELDKKGA